MLHETFQAPVNWMRHQARSRVGVEQSHSIAKLTQGTPFIVFASAWASSHRPRADALAHCLEHSFTVSSPQCSSPNPPVRLLRRGSLRRSTPPRRIRPRHTRCDVQQPRVTIHRLQPTRWVRRVEHFLIGCACATPQTSRRATTAM